MASTKIVLVTGANSGIGYEAIKALLQSSQNKYTILLGGRSKAKADEAVQKAQEEVPGSKNTLQGLEIDLESDESIAKAAEEVSRKFGRLDTLVNNAGVSMDASVLAGKMTKRQAYNMNWDVNVVGTHIVTESFLPLILKSSDTRIVFNTSGLSSLAICSDPNHPLTKYPEAGLPKPFSPVGYMSSKTGLNMVMVQWARQLKNDGVKVWAVSPGLIASNLGGDPEAMKKMGGAHPSQGGKALVACIEGERDDQTGKVVNFGKGDAIQPW